MSTDIEWADDVWNPVSGCRPVSAGCLNCYAAAIASRQMSAGHEGLTRMAKRRNRQGKLVALPVFNGSFNLHPERLAAPLLWRRPKRIFVNSMSDLFLEGVPFEFIDRVYARMLITSLQDGGAHPTYIILTKRIERALKYLTSDGLAWRLAREAGQAMEDGDAWHDSVGVHVEKHGPIHERIHLGVSAENQATFDERVLVLLQCPAAVRIVSMEPLLGPIDASRALPHHGPFLDWVVVGGESGPGARPCHVDWVRSIVRQCQTATLPVFVKQLGAVVWDRNDAGFNFCGEHEPHQWPEAIGPDQVEHNPRGFRDEYQGAPVRIRLVSRKGKEPAEWPETLRVRELPSAEKRAR